MGKNANLGYLFQRDYYHDLTYGIWTDSSKGKTLQESFFKMKNDDLIRSSKRKVDSDFLLNIGEKDGLRVIVLQTLYPGLITGIGMVHQTGMQGECKLGMAFDYTSGLPIISGSSVKGLLRSMFPILPFDKKLEDLTDDEKKLLVSKRQFIIDSWNNLKKDLANLGEELPTISESDVDELADTIFNGIKDGESLPIYERDIFFDAEIIGDYTEQGFLGLDYITAHNDELKDPNPVQFLKIMPKVNLVFRFRLASTKLSSEVTITANAKKELFRILLKTVGIGAKTNVGYGQLGDISSEKINVEQTSEVTNYNPVPSINDSTIRNEEATDIEIPKTINKPAFEWVEGEGVLQRLSGLKVRIDNPKYSKDLYELKFEMLSDKKKIKKSTNRVKVEFKTKNNKVIEVFFKSVVI